MKKLVLALFISIIVLSAHQHALASTSPLKEIDDISNLLKEEELTIDSWEVLLKESVNDAGEIMDKVEKKFPNSVFETEKTGEITKTVIQLQDSNHIQEQLVIINPVDPNHEKELIYKIYGNSWGEKQKKFYNDRISEIKTFLFTDKVTKFSCVKTQSDDNIIGVYLFKKIKEKFDVQTLSNIHEEDFNVVSGYTDRWKTAIPISDKPMNIQMAARKGLGGKTTITIGTPIIAIEY